MLMLMLDSTLLTPSWGFYLVFNLDSANPGIERVQQRPPPWNEDICVSMSKVKLSTEHPHKVCLYVINRIMTNLQ